MGYHDSSSVQDGILQACLFRLYTQLLLTQGVIVIISTSGVLLLVRIPDTALRWFKL